MQRRKFESILLASDDSSSDFESDDAASIRKPFSSPVTINSPLRVLSPNSDVEVIEVEPLKNRTNSPEPAIQSSSGTLNNAARLTTEASSKKSSRTRSSSAASSRIPSHLKTSIAPSVTVSGNDSATPEAEVSHWRSLVAQASSSGQHYIDPEFPPTQLSVDGKPEESTEKKPVEPQPLPGTIPQCRCGIPASSTVVKSDTPNKGRPYYHCRTRRCQFFAWGDGLERSKVRKRLKWMRFPMVPIVTDFGFSAADLRQGGVGDCWFMSALAVVAERHDLIARLFTDTARNAAGCYQVRLFMDGKWRSIVVDDMLPVTDDPRRAELAFESKLAFSRCGSSTGGQQLWVSILEKAYAKAHGSYQAISGGQISEALLDLTGCPTEDIDLSAADLDLEHLWRKLCEFRRLKFPMGCSTDSDPSLREVGLFGSHAYSILDVREARLIAPSFEANFGSRVGGEFGGHGEETVRLVRIRNPHGVGEFNGDWSDKSAKWSGLLFPCGEGSQGEELERTGVDDGTFWMDWTHFLMGYSRIDVCYAHQDWHCKSLENMFPANQDKLLRLCAKSYIVAVRSDTVCKTSTVLHVSAIQPTKRGSWCRSDRKKSYRPGGVQLLLAKCDACTGAVLSIVQSAFDGADDRATVTCVLEADPRVLFVVFPLCLGQAPTAAESTKLQPFSMRFFAESPLDIQEFSPLSPLSPVMPNAAQLDYDGLFASLSRAALTALQMALVSPPPSLPSISFTSQTSTAAVGKGPMQQFALPQSSKLRRRVIRGEMGCDLLIARGEGVLFLVALHRGVDFVRGDSRRSGTSSSSYLTAASNEPVCAKITVMAKSHTARSVSGLVKSDNDLAEKYYQSLPKPDPAQSAGGWRPKWPAKWKAYCADVVLHPNQQAVVLILTKSGMLAELGAIEFSVVPTTSDEMDGAAPAQPKALQPTLGKWFQGKSGNKEASHRSESSSAGLFSPFPLNTNALSTLERCLNQQSSTISLVRDDNNAAEERAIAEAIEASKRQSRDLVDDNDDDILKAIIASTVESNNDCTPFVDDRTVSQPNNDKQLKEKWKCERCTFENLPTVHLCEMCGFLYSRNAAASITAVEVVDLVEPTQEICVATANEQNSSKHERHEEAVHSDPPPKRAKNEEVAQPTAAEARAACIEARLKRFDK